MAAAVAKGARRRPGGFCPLQRGFSLTPGIRSKYLLGTVGLGMNSNKEGGIANRPTPSLCFRWRGF